MPTKSDLVAKYFAACKAEDRATFEYGLADGFAFTSPYDDAIGRVAFLNAAGRTTSALPIRLLRP